MYAWIVPLSFIANSISKFIDYSIMLILMKMKVYVCKNSMTCSRCTERSEINILLNYIWCFFNHCCISSFGIFCTYFGYIQKHSYKVYILSELSITTIMLYREYCIEKIEETTVAIIRILNSENLYFYTKFNNYAEDITRKAS